MSYLPLLTWAEGEMPSLRRCESAPIRLYPDRWIEDDNATRFTGRIRRNRLSRREFKIMRKEARDFARGHRPW